MPWAESLFIFFLSLQVLTKQVKRGKENCFKEASVGKGWGMWTESIMYIYFRKEKMFSVLLSYVTLQHVVHLCPDNEACNPAFHMCGNALQSDQHSFLQPVFRGNMPFTPSVRSHFPVRWRALFFLNRNLCSLPNKTWIESEELSISFFVFWQGLILKSER